MVIINEIVRKNYLKISFFAFLQFTFSFLTIFGLSSCFLILGIGEGKNSIRETKTTSFRIEDMFLLIVRKNIYPVRRYMRNNDSQE